MQDQANSAGAHMKHDCFDEDCLCASRVIGPRYDFMECSFFAGIGTELLASKPCVELWFLRGFTGLMGLQDLWEFFEVHLDFGLEGSVCEHHNHLKAQSHLNTLFWLNGS